MRASERQGERGRRGEGRLREGLECSEHEGARGPQPLGPAPAAAAALKKAPALPSPARQVCAASAGRARSASAGLLKRAPESPPPTGTSTAGSLGLSEHPATLHTRPAVSSPPAAPPPAPSPGNPFLPSSRRSGVSAHRPSPPRTWQRPLLTPKVGGQGTQPPTHTLRSTAKRCKGVALLPTPVRH